MGNSCQELNTNELWKKIVFSLVTVPLAIFSHDAGEWQKRRMIEKEKEAERRAELLNSEAIDITPVDGKFPFHGKTRQQIEDEYGFKKVKVKGLLDIENYIKVQATVRGEKGFKLV